MIARLSAAWRVLCALAPTQNAVPREAHDLIVAHLQQQVIDARNDRNEAIKRLLEICDPGVNARLAPPPVAPKPRPVVAKPEYEAPVI